MREGRKKSAGLPTGYEPKRAEKPVKDACRSDEEFSALVEPERMRRFLQEVVVQKFRINRGGWAAPLASNVFGLVYDDGYSRFAELPPSKLFDIRSEIALVAAWLAAQIKDEHLFRLALDKIREQSRFDHRLTHVYRGHIECIGRETFGRSVENAAPFEFKPEDVHKLLKGSFAGLEPLPNVERAITVRHVKSQMDAADSLDATVPGSNKTFFQWLSELRDEALEKDLRNDDGFFVGSVVLLEALDTFLYAALRKPDILESRRCFDRICAVYAELMVQSRKGTPQLYMSPNAQSLLDQADKIMMKARNSMK